LISGILVPSLWTGSGLLDNDWKWNMNWRLVFGVMTFAGACCWPGTCPPSVPARAVMS
jgi:hypothetical protein